MQVPDSFFGSVTTDEFLSDYWHKKPLLVRSAWPDFEPPFSVEEFMALSARPDAFSRVVVQRGGESPWQASEGPFEKSDFEKLPDSHWTLLIQEVDRLLPEVREMLNTISFIPKWRIDDVMVSYATNQGGVGAHIDDYDVFMLQAMGKRRWQINTVPVEEEVLFEGYEMRILSDFRPDCDWVLEPGDMLYLPPRIAHFGVALEPAMTFSLGCRAPGAREMISAILESAIEEIDPDLRYADPDIKASSDPGRLGSAVVSWVRDLIEGLVRDEDALKDIVGSILSEPRRYSDLEPEPRDSLRQQLRSGGILRPANPSQIFYDFTSQGEVCLFAAGESFLLEAGLLPLVKKLTESTGLREDDLSIDREFEQLLQDLFDNGTLIVD